MLIHEYEMNTYYKGIHKNVSEGRHKIIGSLLIFIPQYLFPDSCC